MDAATALSAVQTVLAALDCQDLRKLCSMLKYKSELKDLIETVGTIKKLLLQADTESLELNHVGQDWVNKLKDAVYDTEDLFDEYKTVAEQHKYKKPGRIISKKVRLFFSSKKLAFNMSREIKKVREQLDKIAKDHKDFGFSTLYKPARIKEETCSYVYEQNIIGRDADKKKIVDLLLKDDLENNISFVTIVGIGGLGKTALAKLVFSDHRIREAFEENMMYWVCVSENFGMKDILGKMIGNKNLEFEDLYKKVRNKIERKRYFLVLDDVWCEEGIKWDDLRDFLKLGGKGSRILVTSRSEAVATAIGNYPMHKLQGLSEKDSWELFRKISLGDNKEDEAIAGFVEIGRDILKKCASVPLSIRVVASLLRGQDINAWQSYRRIDLAKMRDDENDYLMPTLMFSYYHLDPALKRCFSFCSIFPQDHRIYKEELISLWSAHGYLGTDNSMEDVGERYFSILLHRCFFHDLKQQHDYYVGWKFKPVESVKMHDLMHVLARKVAGKESLSHEVGKVRHLFVDSEECVAKLSSSSNYTCKTLRTLFMMAKGYSDEGEFRSIISNFCNLKYLSLWFMKNMEYIECNAPSPSAKFFPCLEKLEFVDMPKLEGWWRDVTWMEKETVFIPSFPQLCELCISSCERLAYIPQCPHLKKLNLKEVNEALTFYKKEGGVESNPIYLNKLTIDYSCVFNPLIGEYMGSADSVCIRLSDIENLGTIREGFQSCASSIHELYLKNCRGMENLGIEHLTNLNSLTLVNNIEGIPWNSLYSLSSLCLHSCDDLEELGECVISLKSLQLLSLFGCKELKSLPKVIRHLTSLTTLDITVCPQLKSLPEAIKHLTSLATIKIEDYPELKSLPEAIKHLTSLNTLTLINPSSELEDRCHENGEDWLKICHISYYNDY